MRMLCAVHAYSLLTWVHAKTYKHVHTAVLLQVIKYAFASVVDREGEWNAFWSKYCHRYVNHELCELKST